MGYIALLAVGAGIALFAIVRLSHQEPAEFGVSAVIAEKGDSPMTIQASCIADDSETGMRVIASALARSRGEPSILRCPLDQKLQFIVRNESKENGTVSIEGRDSSGRRHAYHSGTIVEPGTTIRPFPWRIELAPNHSLGRVQVVAAVETSAGTETQQLVFDLTK